MFSDGFNRMRKERPHRAAPKKHQKVASSTQDIALLLHSSSRTVSSLNWRFFFAALLQNNKKYPPYFSCTGPPFVRPSLAMLQKARLFYLNKNLLQETKKINKVFSGKKENQKSTGQLQKT